MTSKDSQTAESQITVPKFMAMKAAGRKITMSSAYDYTFAGSRFRHRPTRGWLSFNSVPS